MKMNRRSVSLNGDWLLSGRLEAYDSQPSEVFDEAAFRSVTGVPGNIELALEAAGAVPELYFGRNMEKLRPFEFYEWLYERDFEYDGSLREPVLVFDGLDCFGTVYLNGVCLGKTANAFIEHRFGVGSALKQGKNHIAVHIGSAVGHLKDFPMLPGARAHFEYNAEVIYLRKPAHDWGWDISPRAAIGGLWRGVRLEETPETRIDELFLDTIRVSEHSAKLRLMLRTTAPALFPEHGLEVKVQGVCKNHRWEVTRSLWSSSGDFVFDVENPELWQVRNYGEPNLYAVKVQLCRRFGEVLAEENLTLGIRQIELFRRESCTDSPDPDFQFIVNGIPVRIFGSNHVPLDCFHSRDRAKYEFFMRHIVDLNCNMIRAWGGGVYEDDAFFDLCDRSGVLVWQDFMMGCCIYPDQADFKASLSCELESTIRKLRQHPSIALWAGDNECDLVSRWFGANWDPNGNPLTRDLLPHICRMLDPMRPYLPSSPYVPERSYQMGLQFRRDPMDYAPEQHLWGPRDYFKSDFYTKSMTSFTSETGYHGCTTLDSMRKYLPKAQVWPPDHNDMWDFHASAPFLSVNDQFAYRTDLMSKQVREYFGVRPETAEGFCRASQIVQAEAVKYLIELNKLRSKRSGVLWWNLLDCWPQFSDAVMDYYGAKKLAYYYIKVVQNPLLGMVSEADSWMRKVVFANDTMQDAEGTFTLENGLTGELLQQGKFSAPARTVVTALTYEVCTTEKRLLLLRWHCADGRSGVNHMLTGHPAFDFAVYEKSVLPLLAKEYGTFNAETVGLKG